MDIPALFSRKSSHLSALSHSIRMAQTSWCGVCDVPEGQVRARAAIQPSCACGASQTLKSHVCASPRQFYRVFCFHRHSRIVPRKTALKHQPSATASGWRRPGCVGSAMSRRDRSGHVLQSSPVAPSAHRRRSKTTSAPAHDFFTEPFVFIYILALFCQFYNSVGAVREPPRY